MSAWSRRRFLTTALLALAGMPAALASCGRRAPDELLDAALLGWFDEAAVQRIGRKLLARGTGWSDARTLRAALGPRLGAAENADAARRALAAAVSEDFRADRTLEVEGWILAESEARLYALAVLRAAAPKR